MAALGLTRLHRWAREGCGRSSWSCYLRFDFRTHRSPDAQTRNRLLGHTENDRAIQSTVRYVNRGFRGTVRLWPGWRANRPWSLFTGLSKAMVGVFGTAAFVVLNANAWQLGVALSPSRRVLLTLASVVALAAWLIIDHELWEHPADDNARERATLYTPTTLRRPSPLAWVLCRAHRVVPSSAHYNSVCVRVGRRWCKSSEAANMA